MAEKQLCNDELVCRIFIQQMRVAHIWPKCYCYLSSVHNSYFLEELSSLLQNTTCWTRSRSPANRKQISSLVVFLPFWLIFER